MRSDPLSALCQPSPVLKVPPTEFAAKLAEPGRAADSGLFPWAADSLVVGCTATVTLPAARLCPNFLSFEAVEGGTVR